MAKSVSISVSLVNGGTDFVPSVIAGRSSVSLDIMVSAKKTVPKDALFVIHGREIFGDGHTQCDWHVGKDIVAGESKLVSKDLSCHELPLSPGCWLLLVDLKIDGSSVSGGDVGCVLLYAKRKDESPLHARAGYNIARVEFAYDRHYKIYYKTYHALLPPTGDPLDDVNGERLRHDFIIEEETWPELQHDGGIGFLFGAYVFHALRETDRAKYCEKVVRRTVSVISDLMHTGDGRLMSILGTKQKRRHRWHVRQQDGFALKFLCQTYFYFRFGPGADMDYSRKVLAAADPIFNYQIAQSLEPGCGGSCKVYDGRILAGLAWYCLAYRAGHGEYPKGDAVGKVLRCAELFTQNLLRNHGWYDEGCLVENQCHIWCGNMNLLNGLLPTRRIVRELRTCGNRQAQNIEHHLEKGISEAFRFITYMNGAITGEPAFVPTQTSQWAAGNMYELCDEYLRQVGDDAGVRLLRDHLILGAAAGSVDCFHRNNTSGAALMHCDEYLALDPKPPLPWDIGDKDVQK